MEVNEESALPVAAPVLILPSKLRLGVENACLDGDGVMFLEIRSLRKFCWRLEDAVFHGFGDGFSAGVVSADG
jgi:hypothetical protein